MQTWTNYTDFANNLYIFRNYHIEGYFLAKFQVRGGGRNGNYIS